MDAGIAETWPNYGYLKFILGNEVREGKARLELHETPALQAGES